MCNNQVGIAILKYEAASTTYAMTMTPDRGIKGIIITRVSGPACCAWHAVRLDTAASCELHKVQVATATAGSDRGCAAADTAHAFKCTAEAARSDTAPARQGCRLAIALLAPWSARHSASMAWKLIPIWSYLYLAYTSRVTRRQLRWWYHTWEATTIDCSYPR